MRFQAVGVGGFLVLASIAPGVAVPEASVPEVSQADARLALQIASGLATSAPAEVARADVAAPAGEAPGARVTIADAVLLMRGARGQAPAGVVGTAFMKLEDTVRLQDGAVRNFTLARAYRFSGRLVDPSGKPVSGVVELEDDRGYQKAFSQFGGDGNFNLAVGKDALHARVATEVPSRDGQGSIFYSVPLPPTQDVALTGDTHREIVRPEPPPTGFIEGTVSAGGLPVEDVQASVKLPGGGYGTSFGLRKAKDGHFRLECPAGEATLAFQSWNGGDRMTTVEYKPAGKVTVTAGRTATSSVTFPRLANVSAEIQGGPDFPVMMVVFDRERYDEDWWRSTIRNPERGGFSLPVVPGTYRAEVFFEQREGRNYRQYGYRMDATIPEAGGPITLICAPDPPERALAGRVTDADGRPLRATVLLHSMKSSKDGFTFLEAATDPDGRYSVSAPEGLYSVTVQPAGYR